MVRSSVWIVVPDPAVTATLSAIRRHLPGCGEALRSWQRAPRTWVRILPESKMSPRLGNRSGFERGLQACDSCLAEIFGHALGELRLVSEPSQGGVATPTEQAPNMAVGMVMVDDQFQAATVADRAPTILAEFHLGILRRGQPVGAKALPGSAIGRRRRFVIVLALVRVAALPSRHDAHGRTLRRPSDTQRCVAAARFSRNCPRTSGSVRNSPRCRMSAASSRAALALEISSAACRAARRTWE